MDRYPGLRASLWGCLLSPGCTLDHILTLPAE